MRNIDGWGGRRLSDATVKGVAIPPTRPCRPTSPSRGEAFEASGNSMA